MNNPKNSGYGDVEHTADWQLRVWAPDLTMLFEQAARGMYAIMGIKLNADDRTSRAMDIWAQDYESLLVAFLGELLYFEGVERLGFDAFKITVVSHHLNAQVAGAQIISQTKEIKAVTYHNLKVETTADGYQVGIVFDI